MSEVGSIPMSVKAQTDKIERETRFYITSLAWIAHQIGPVIRGHWAVEQGLVGILQLAQKGVAFEIGLEAAQRLETARNLLVQRGDIGRQQAVLVERLALALGERCALVNPTSSSVKLRIGLQLVSAQRSSRESCSRLGHDKLL